jgi:predicted nuclease of predicted toxin-antitoxin system
VNQKGARTVPLRDKGFDVLYSQKGIADLSVRELANAQQRVLVSTEKDFGEFHLTPEDVPHGAIWLRPTRTSQRQTGELLAGLCRVLLQTFSANPYNFAGKIVEVYSDRIEIRTVGGVTNSYSVPAPPTIN